MDEWLSDRDRAGFYASQDADYSMEDDGDYFTWTLAETRAVLTEDESRVAELHYDINEIGEMHHDPAKNVLYIRAGIDEIARRLGLHEDRVRALLDSAKKKMYASRLTRPTPYVDKTVYVGWNAMCISAYLEVAKVLNLPQARQFALRSLDRLISEGWNVGKKPGSTPASHTLKHVMAYSDPKAEPRETAGVLDDYACAVIACLDAYEAIADLSYFQFAKAIADAMVLGFFDSEGGGFFDTDQRIITTQASQGPLGILGTRRKPFQDSPTPAGNSAAAIALLRVYAYTNENSYRERAERTLEVYAGVAAQHGIFAATYGLAVARFTSPHTQVIVVGSDDTANELYRAAIRPMALNTSVIRLDPDKVVAQNLPPALAETIPQLPALRGGRSLAVLCSGFSCQPPVFDAADIVRILGSRTRPAA